MELRQILVVDDDPEDRAIITDAMKAIGKEELLFIAENGEEALSFLDKCMAENALPCLIVLDLNMPKMSGTETLRMIKANDKFTGIKVIIYSTSINPFEKDRCIELGAQDYFTKPISFNESKATAKKLVDLCNPDR